MLKKTLKVLSFLAILSLSANANDLLADISNGVISDSSLGVKVLNPEQMSKIRGGYIPYDFTFGNLSLVIAFTSDSTELGARFTNDGGVIRNSIGLCPMGQVQCYFNPETKMHNELNTQRLFEYWAAFGNYYKVTQYYLAYGVQKEIQYSSHGNPFTVFKYKVFAVDKKDYSLHDITNSYNLNDNMIVNELKREYKTRLELNLGGM